MSREDDDPGPGTAPPRVLLRVVSGEPTPQELAALLAVVLGRPGGDQADARRPASGWTSRAALLRRPLLAGPGAWRASGLPGLQP